MKLYIIHINITLKFFKSLLKNTLYIILTALGTLHFFQRGIFNFIYPTFIFLPLLNKISKSWINWNEPKLHT